MVSHIDDETPDPVLDERVRSVLDALAAPTEPGPLPGEVDAVAAFRAQHRTRRFSMSNLTPFRVAVASTVGAGVFLTGGVAAAATGSLPGAAQDVAHDVISALPLGFDVPAGEKAPEQADERQGEETQAEPVDAEQDDAEAADNGKGEEISGIATDPGTTGLDKGTAVSEQASEGRSRAGEQGAPEGAGQQRATQGSESAATAKDHGASTNGTGTAGTKSGGRGGAGSDNGERP